MSIQPGRVLWRIVDEVARAPRARLHRSVFDSSAFLDAALGERMEIARVFVQGRGAVDGGPAFATLLHFWTHALREWLEAVGQGDQLVGAAGYAMCERMNEATARREFERLANRLASSAPELELRGDFIEAYRMIDGSCRTSFVAATDVEWLSLTWAHGFEYAAVLPTHCTATNGWQLHPTA